MRSDGSELPLDWTVRIGTKLAQRVIIAGQSYFTCDPGFYSGQLSFKVVAGNRVVGSANVTVNPSLAKLTADQYAALLKDLTDWTRALYRLTGAKIPSAIAVGEVNRLVTFNLIDSYIDLLEGAVHRIADRPVVKFSTDYESLPLLRAKAISASAIRHALRDPRLREATKAEALSAPEIVAALGGNMINRLRQQRRRRHSEIYEHRALLGFLNWLDGVCMRLGGALASEAESDRNILLADVAVWRGKIAKMRRREVFTGLEPELTLHPSNIFTMKPSYRSAYSIAMKLRLGLGAGGHQVTLPIAQTPLLYEMWCLAGLLLAVARGYPAARPSILAGLLGAPAEDGFGWVLPQGNAWTIPLGDDIVLNYQLRIGTAPGPYGLQTTVVGAVPDITLAKLDAARTAVKLVVLDPKYRVGLSLQDGIRSLHFYRDAIVAAAGHRPIIGAAALHPDDSFPRQPQILSLNWPTAVLFRPGIHSNFEPVIAAAVAALKADVTSKH